jgi:hypothetical protein
MRISDDLDLLVASGDLDRAADVLISLGYARGQGDRIGADGLPELHLAFYHPTQASIELHWRIHWYGSALSPGLLESATRGEDGVRRLEGADLAAAMLAFYARDGFNGIRLASDIAGWVMRHPPLAGSGGLLDDHVRSYPALAPTWRAAALVVERVAGIPVETWLTGDAARPSRRERLAARLANPSARGTLGQQWANVALVDALLAPRGTKRDLLHRTLDRAPEGGLVRHAAITAIGGALAVGRVRRGDWDPVIERVRAARANS